MEQILALWHQFGATHPIYSHVLVFLVGAFAWPKFLDWLHETGIPKITAWADEKQQKALRKMGLSEEQIDAIQLDEAKDLRIAAKTIEDRVTAEKSAREIKPPEK